MTARRVERELIIGITPCGRPDGRLVVGICRGGGHGVLDLGTNPDAAWPEVALIERRWDGDYGVKIPAGAVVDPAVLSERVSTVLVTDSAEVQRFQGAGRDVLVEVTNSDEAEVAVAAGAAGLVLKGAEAGGRIGEETAFVLLQRLVRRLDLPLWVQGGIGLHTAGAVIAGGARGVVLDAQLALARDCTLPEPIRAAITAMDGSETVVVGGHRIYTRPDLPSPDLTGPPSAVAAQLGAADAEVDHLGRLLDANDAGGRPWPLRGLAATTAARQPNSPVAYAVVADTLDDLRSKVDALRAGASPLPRDCFVAASARGDAGGDDSLDESPEVAFLFPGEGSQRAHMAADLFVAFPALRRYLELGGRDLTDRIFPPAFGPDADDRVPSLTETRLAQPALGVVELAVADLLGRCGVRPDLVAGHNYGEIPALALAGALDETAVLALSHARADAILAALPTDDPGTMAAARGPVDEVRAAPELAAASDVLREHLAGVTVNQPVLPVWSNTTATRYPTAPDDVRELLAGQVSSPVAFRQQIEAMYEAGARVFVEAGPGRVLTQLVDRILGDRAIACDVAEEPGIRRFLSALAELAATGVPVDTSLLFAGRTAVVDAPASVRPAALRLDGQLIRDRDGQVVAGTLPPATEFPPLHVGQNGHGAQLPASVHARTNGNGHGPDVQSTVSEYLRSLQQIVAAERDVVLAMLGAPMVGGAVQAANAAPPTVTQVAGEPAPERSFPVERSGARTEAPAEPAPESSFPVERSGARTASLGRSVPALVGLPDAVGSVSLADVMVGLVDGGSNIVGPLCDFLRAMDAVPLVLDPNEAVLEELGLLVDLTALRPGTDEPTAAVTAQFARLQAAVRAGVPEIVVVTGLGGGLGIGASNSTDTDPTTWVGAAALGMVRTAARELPDVRIRVVDLPAAGDPHLRARQIADELACGAPPAEVGYASGRRQTVEIVTRSLDAAGEAGEHRNDFHLGSHSVVLVTGGARGIGARCALELARRFGSAFEVVGRTPLPVGDEASDLAEATDERAIRQVLIQRGDLTPPAEHEAEVQRILATREVRRTLVELQRHSRSVGYHTVDVRDTTVFAALVEDLRLRHGRLDGVLHAAGIRDDQRIGDKTAESFARVFDTKVSAADLLADAVDFGGFAVFFGSVSGVFGNPGQVDYAAANTVLDVLANSRSGVSRERRLLSVDWGPWSGSGTVTPELARQDERRGIGLVDPDAGAAALIDELRYGAPDPQVVLMAEPCQ